MAEQVDAPDSKSGHFGGVGSIPSTPTNKNCSLSNFKSCSDAHTTLFFFRKWAIWRWLEDENLALRSLIEYEVVIEKVEDELGTEEPPEPDYNKGI